MTPPNRLDQQKRAQNWADGRMKKPTTPCYADDRNFYKLEKWTRDGTKVDQLLYAGNNLDFSRKPSNIDRRSD
jgi:hypothetical protein